MSKVSTRWAPRLLTLDRLCFLIKSTPHQAGHVAGELGTFWSRSRQFSWTFPHPRWVLGPPLRARDQTTIHAVETPLFSPSKEGQGGVGREGDGLRLLGCKGHCFHWLPSKKPNYEWGILCQLAEAAAKGNQVKRPGKLTKGDLFHQDNAPAQKYVVAMASCCAWLRLWSGWSSSIFTWFGTIWLFSVPQMRRTKNPHCWEAISDRSWGHICSWGLFEEDESFYSTGIQALKHLWKKCVSHRGDYVEKWTVYGQIRPLHHSQPMNFSTHPRIWL